MTCDKFKLRLAQIREEFDRLERLLPTARYIEMSQHVAEHDVADLTAAVAILRCLADEAQSAQSA